MPYPTPSVRLQEPGAWLNLAAQGIPPLSMPGMVPPASALALAARRRTMPPRPATPMAPPTRGGGGFLADILRAVAAQRMAPAPGPSMFQETPGGFGEPNAPPEPVPSMPWGDWGLPGTPPPDTAGAPDPLAEAERLQAENAAAIQQALAESERRSAEDATATATRREQDPGLQYALGLVEQMKAGGMSMPQAIEAYKAQMLNRPTPAAGALPENFGNMPSAPTRPTFSDFGAFRSAVSRRLGGMFGRR